MSQHNTLADWLIRRAARGAPVALSERLQEEWQADLLTRSSNLSRLRFGFGCCWASLWIAREHAFASSPAAATATGNIDILHEEPGLLSGRPTSFLMVVLLHAVVFYALFLGLGPTFTKTMTPPALVPTVEDPKPREPVPVPSARPDIPRTVYDLPPPTVTLPSAAPDDPSPVVAPLVDSAPTPPTFSNPTPPHISDRVQGGPGIGFPNADDFYPQTARRLEEQGNVIVQVCVDPRGRLTSQPTTVQSSGNARLDGGALVLAKAGSGHYRATTEDGHPVSSCYSFRVVFTLKK
jgi:periplasmic protein TonB